jgi:hypothetical protein
VLGQLRISEPVKKCLANCTCLARLQLFDAPVQLPCVLVHLQLYQYITAWFYDLRGSLDGKRRTPRADALSRSIERLRAITVSQVIGLERAASKLPARRQTLR